MLPVVLLYDICTIFMLLYTLDKEAFQLMAIDSGNHSQLLFYLLIISWPSNILKLTRCHLSFSAGAPDQIGFLDPNPSATTGVIYGFTVSHHLRTVALLTWHLARIIDQLIWVINGGMWCETICHDSSLQR